MLLFILNIKHSVEDMSEEGVMIDMKLREDKKLFKKDTEQDGGYKDVPDADWGWCLVAACFLCNIVNDVATYSFGNIPELMRSDLDEGVGFLSLVWCVFIGLIIAVFINSFGSRTTCIIGSVIATASMFVSSFSTSFTSLIVTYGLLVGFGLGFLFLSAFILLREYFRERISLAIGIGLCLFGTGVFLSAPFICFLLGPFGWWGCNRVMTLLSLDCGFVGIAMEPNWENIQCINENNEKIEEEKKKINLRMLCDSLFILITLANFTNAMAIYISYYYLPLVARQSSLSSDDASVLISVVGISNTVGQILSSWLSGFKWTNAQGIIIISSTAACVLTYFLSNGLHYWSLLVLTAVIGFLITSGPTVTYPLIVDLMGIENLNPALGILIFVRSMAALFGLSAAGFILRNISPNITFHFYIASFIFGVSTVLQTLILCHSRMVRSRSPGYTVL